MTDDLSTLGLECSEDWVPFPVTGTIDLSYWARYQAEELVERYARDGEKGNARALARDLERAAADSRSREPLGAFGWYISGHQTVAAVLELDAIHPDATYPEVTLDLLAESMSATDFGPPDVRHVRLPLGDAVRIRQNLVEERKRLFGPRTVVRTLFHGVRPPTTDAAVTLMVSWTEPVLDEPLEGIVDGIARTLKL
ncbi:hypothetical protein OIE82_14530 [Streptomyces althioticus]|jgi:hypothetical protein|uniref:Uncharacterized protein n=1 Tax=Streptomyces althioticus TaxID=83380 RepID=A0ABZ1Y762_9ACTN|nr:hypothetical protein OG968_14725 [Streptomyces althioticus]GGQ74729.1 hypothetical protein GCM10010267_42190 [Streptomyces griseorubens]